MLQWLNYVSTEIHKGCFALMFNPTVPDEAKGWARGNLTLNSTYVDGQIGSRSFLVGERFTVADAYLGVGAEPVRAGRRGAAGERAALLRRHQGQAGGAGGAGGGRRSGRCGEREELIHADGRPSSRRRPRRRELGSFKALVK